MFPTKLQKGESYGVLLERYNQLVDYLRETRLVSGSGIRINKRAAGITIESLAKASGGGQSAPASPMYQGMFALSVEIDPDTDDYLLVVNGGVAYVNATRFDMPEYTAELRTNPTTYVYFSARYDDSSHSFEDVEIKHYTEPKSDTQYRKYILLGTVVYADQSYTAVQNQYGQLQMLFFGDCGDNDE